MPDPAPILTTPDGSRTALNARYGEAYGSRHGARAQAWHVFVEGSGTATHPAPRVLEIGFGVGVNTRATLAATAISAAPLHYLAYEFAPVSAGTLREVAVGGDAETHPAWAALCRAWDERAAGFMVAALTSTFAFSLAHGVPASIAGILPLAYVLARVVQHSGSLWNSVIIHAANNTLAVALGALLAGRDLGQAGDASSLLKTEALRLPLAGGAALFGVAVLVVCHIWLTPRADPQERRAPGPWLSGAYVAVVLFGLVSLLLTLPFAQAWLGRVSAVLH